MQEPFDPKGSVGTPSGRLRRQARKGMSPPGGPASGAKGRRVSKTPHKSQPISSTPPAENFDGDHSADASKFDPHARDLTIHWSSYAKTVLCINTYPNGVTLSVHHPLASTKASDTLPLDSAADATPVEDASNAFQASAFHLRLPDTRDYQLPPGKHFLYREGFAEAVERHLQDLHGAGALASTVVYLGTTSDPFLSFQKKFNVTVACLQLFEQYSPGFCVVQSRSPMVIAALPTLKALSDRVVVALSVESRLENVIQRYTPGQPRLSERLLAADGLRAQGIPVQLVAAPLLPYGDVNRHAEEFAQLLIVHGDFVSVGCLATGSQTDEIQLRSLPIAKRLVADNQFRWLRPHSYRELYLALKRLAPEKLALPVEPPVEPSQLNLFAA